MFSCCCDCTNSYNCPCKLPGLIPQPFHLPGYTGHIPTMRDKFGGSFGTLSHKVLEDPCAVAAPCPILQPPCWCPMMPSFNHGEERFAMKGILSPRCCCTDIYRPGEPMHDTYTGHVPGFFGCSHGPNRGRGVINSRIFLNNAGYFNSKFKFRDFLDWNHPQASQFDV